MIRRALRISFLAASVLAALAGCSSETQSSGPQTSQTAEGAASNAVSAGDYEAIKQARGFAAGAKAEVLGSLPTAYVLFDPQCPHCATLWNAAKPLYSTVQLKWIPVALLNSLSATQSGLLIEAQAPIALMDGHEKAMVARSPDPLMGSPAPASVDAAKDNTRLLRNLRATSVPTIVYTDPVTKQPKFISGALSTPQLANLLGVATEAPASAQ